jgi:hypothetical protein
MLMSGEIETLIYAPVQYSSNLLSFLVAQNPNHTLFFGFERKGIKCKLTPKRLRGVFFKKNTPKRPFLAQEALLNFF